MANYSHLLSQVRVSHQCAHLWKMGAGDGVAAGQAKDHAVVQMISVRYGEVHHQREMLLI